MNSLLGATVISISAATLAGIFGLWIRLEHRLSRLEEHIRMRDALCDERHRTWRAPRGS